MAIRPFAHSISSNFRAPPDADVGVLGRRSHIFAVPALHLTNTSHVQCTARLGTERWGVDVKDVFGYQGAVPRGPVMLGSNAVDGSNRTAEYADCVRRTGLFGRATVRAMLECALLGAAIGAVSVLVPAGVAIAILHAMPARFIPLASSVSLWVRASWTPRAILAASSIACMATDWLEYRRAHGSFQRLHALSQHFDALQQEEARPEQRVIAKARSLATSMQQNECWVMQQAASEYMEELQRLDIQPDAQPAQAA